MEATFEQELAWQEFRQKCPNLADEFSQRMAGLRNEGLVDMKFSLVPSARGLNLSADEMHEHVASHIATLNNVLRLRSEGHCQPLKLEAN